MEIAAPFGYHLFYYHGKKVSEGLPRSEFGQVEVVVVKLVVQNQRRAKMRG